ncbi:NusB antitermination factor [Acetoanaerobium noterae]|jgi:N utilization substance protein B|uniref:Transcription antitermination protein NusB n=1 Tax=Acetoanaerobium noterae TaxID=745369 RepID=A0A1T5CJA8_9FIRM|nr:transcription antitermination factor NusB [Acetoanaerobium noterae]MBP8762642.1 transcription antitermination factor NusB [Acetoanaerobium sp.]MBP9499653.1 transcription antitermination factor NusB [Acetoanaerobium sp.]MBP9561871.1 transcription antitermination factor NusB [Acetoanaerobium sp.]SKB59547.1 NusB antitermination factor [Acetoanaerobium noterae]
MKRKELREAAVKLFYEMDIQKTFEHKFYKNFLAENELIALKDNYLKEVFDSFLLNRDNIDDIIQKSSTSWDIKRIAKVDLSILRVAITEILYLSDIPDKVSINEAIDLAKKYGDENSYKFVNGLLGKIVKNEN